MKLRLLLLLLATFFLATSCADVPPPPDGVDYPRFDPGEPQPIPHTDQRVFVSADTPGSAQDDRNWDAPTDANGSQDGDVATVEEGDIYRVMDGDLLLNLNYYRGLQIIDIDDPSTPTIIGNVRVSGTPVEMYTTGDRAYVLMNNWTGYYGVRTDIWPAQYTGGVVMAIDISNPNAPTVIGQEQISGQIRTSRMTRRGEEGAIFVAATDYQNTYVMSFDISNGTLEKRSSLDLGGHVADIQATPESLLVARWDYSTGTGSAITLVDISAPTGTMVEGDTFTAKGRVEKKTNMDIWGDVVRVASNAFSGDRANYVETFDASDIQNITAIDEAAFGEEENLYATIFLEEKAFFVTYQRVDPFHAFHISEDGIITEKAEFIVTGWNDFFKPAFNASRLLGVGINDVDGWKLAVSLYDITDLTNANPLLVRKSLDLSWSSSEAQWDDRAFTVLENATSVVSEDGQYDETGLILLPFQGWNEHDNAYTSGVQILTFSEDSLTLRGIMNHGTPVRRSFEADDALTANLSEAQLSLFDTDSPDTPVELSRLDLAPNYTDIMRFGDYIVRRKNTADYFHYWWDRPVDLPDDTVEIVAFDADLEGTAITAFEIAPASFVYKVRNLLVAVSTVPLPKADLPEQEWETTINIWDLADPLAPVESARLVTDQLPPAYSYNPYVDYGAPAVDSAVGLDQYYIYDTAASIRTVNDGLVFMETVYEQALQGTETIRSIYPEENWADWDRCAGTPDDIIRPENNASTGTGDETCSYYSGYITCSALRRVDGTMEPEVCTGAIFECTWTSGEEVGCVEVSPDEIETHENTSTYERYRYWQTYNLYPVDLFDPYSPGLGPMIAMAHDEECVSMIEDGASLLVTYRQPFDIPGDTRPFVKFFFREIGFANPSAPTMGPAVNIPGTIIDVDKSTLITQDYLWGENFVETTINRLERAGASATLKGVFRFDEQIVREVKLDGEGHVIVTHGPAYWGWYDTGVAVDTAPVESPNGTVERPDYPEEQTIQMSVLDLTSDGLPRLSETSIDSWASLTEAVAGRALFTVPGGLLIFNLDDPAQPFSQAYFALRGWPTHILVEDKDIIFGAGRYGIYRFDIDTFNLLDAD